MHLPLVLVVFACLQQAGTSVQGLKAEDLTVEVPSLGTVQGAKTTTVRLGREVAAFTGIPYGTIPRRFSPAVLRDSLTSDGSVFDATKTGPICIQAQVPGMITGNFTEDCLALNIYTPSTKTNELLPVIFFIHGGSFIRWYGGVFNGRRLLDRDVVLVTINYRVNIFGFFCLENDDTPGNLGLYDQVLALQWVQKHIKNFGGDPNRVTLAGQSAGGASVTYLLNSPMAHNLFHGAISSSGDNLSGWTVEATPLADGLVAAEYCKCTNVSAPTQDLKVVAECMRNTPVSTLLASTALFYSAPVIQSFSLSIPKVVPTNPYTTLVTGYVSQVPLMIGTNKNDGSFLLSRQYRGLAPTGLLQNPDFLRNKFMNSLLTSSSFGIVDTPLGIIDSITNEYLGKSKSSGNFTLMAPGIIDIFSVFYFKAAAYLTAKTYSTVNPVYLYSFDYYGTQTFYEFTGGVPEVPRGVAHIDDLVYLFYFADFTTTGDKLISNLMVDNWANFATTGNPNQRNVNTPPMFEYWKKFTVAEQKFLKINLIPLLADNYVSYWVDASKNIK